MADKRTKSGNRSNSVTAKPAARTARTASAPKASRAAKAPKVAKATKPARASKPAQAPKAAKSVKAAKVRKVVRKPAQNPSATEVVAATLVAAAAALRNPKKAQALALEAADDLRNAAKSGVESGTALWQLALDVARRSIDQIGKETGGKKAKKAKKKAGKKK